ncbi:leucine-rich repeat flightless-interacting protein 2-like isoform X3 [Ictalurus furcatus]|uniref:leucine-rich repeat flightless-interacting protein 2-like isoform X3 n=1 Tax=Ictalurus furcatus TaxID=66913 RepID=UPI00235035D9|nr:leucine-rich repeat flightless-interacting protein 2-like isoform X3 [Ictalurus furcatus]
MEINNQLENMETNTQVGDINLNNSYLMSKVNTLEDCVQLLDEELAQTRMRCNEIMTELEQEQEAHRILESHCEEMKTTLKTCDELLKVCEGEVKDHSILKVSLAEVERKYKQAMESNAHLENETFDLMSKMGILQSSMQEMTNKCAEATKNYEKTKHILEYVLATANEREKTLNLEIDLLQASLAEAERHYEFLVTDYYESVDTQNNLRAELSTLHRKVGDLQGALRTVTRECEQLRSMRDKLSLMSTTILNDHELELQAHGTLKEQHVELLTERKREQACLAEAERKYKEVMESNAQLEKEKSDLQSQVNTLQGSVQQLKEEHSETRTKCDEMPVSLAAADKLQEEAMQSKAKMKNEILDLKYHLHTLRDSVRELEIMLSDGEMHCDAIKQGGEKRKGDRTRAGGLPYPEDAIQKDEGNYSEVQRATNDLSHKAWIRGASGSKISPGMQGKLCRAILHASCCQGLDSTQVSSVRIRCSISGPLERG